MHGVVSVLFGFPSVKVRIFSSISSADSCGEYGGDGSCSPELKNLCCRWSSSNRIFGCFLSCSVAALSRLLSLSTCPLRSAFVTSKSMRSLLSPVFLSSTSMCSLANVRKSSRVGSSSC